MFSIKKFSPERADQVKALISAIMEKEFPDQRQAYPLDDLDDIARTYGGIGEAFFVAYFGEEVIGTVAIKKEDERTALLRRIFVKPEFRHRNFGERLLDEAVGFCSIVGYQEVVFKTTSNMRGAIRLCQRKGFVEKARINLGGAELLKFALFLKENSPLA